MIPKDTIEFCRRWLYYDPYPYMYPFLRDESHFIANLQARQTGKTFNGMAKLLHLALLNRTAYSLSRPQNSIKSKTSPSKPSQTTYTEWRQTIQSYSNSYAARISCYIQ